MKKLILALIGFVFIVVALALFGFLDALRTLLADVAATLGGVLSGDWRAMLGFVLAALFVFLVLLFSNRPKHRDSGDDD